jgi:hypothetical protein
MKILFPGRGNWIERQFMIAVFTATAVYVAEQERDEIMRRLRNEKAAWEREFTARHARA